MADLTSGNSQTQTKLQACCSTLDQQNFHLDSTSCTMHKSARQLPCQQRVQVSSLCVPMALQSNVSSRIILMLLSTPMARASVLHGPAPVSRQQMLILKHGSVLSRYLPPVKAAQALNPWCQAASEVHVQDNTAHASGGNMQSLASMPRSIVGCAGQSQAADAQPTPKAHGLAAEGVACQGGEASSGSPAAEGAAVCPMRPC